MAATNNQAKQRQAEQQAKQEIRDADDRPVEVTPDAPVDPDLAKPQTNAARMSEAVRQGLEDRSTEAGAVVDAASDRMASGAPTAGGDIDALGEQAKVVGEEAVGGTTPTPDQDNVDDIAESMGVEMAAGEPVEVTEEVLERDRQRWELNPRSSDRPAETEPFEG